MDISFNQVEHRYMSGTPFEKVALKDFSVTIPSGSFTAVIGHTGSGKSTFIQHINGLLKPTSGTVKVGPYTIAAGEKKIDLKALRKEVGLVFQYPEHQLFEETVEKDISFGPINFGVPKAKAMRRAKELLPHVGLPEHVLTTSPFQLSGGQMRRVAIAGVLAVNPSILVLDEPAASLDPEGRKQMMDLFVRYHKENQTTTVLVTHHMEDAARYADHIIVLHNGQVEMTGGRELIFERASRLREIGLDLPDSVRFLEQIKEKWSLTDVPMHFDLEGTADYLAGFMKGKEE
ncbi:energy-coupling factor ABC transporter ATP-binding protein [Halalkalibacter nanhaiisediminis]|uniref:Energy-coupling factor transporter ATP-binding protein EcfA2 n=1 Tax=Halalkalibacter nanhaiisediminis TaxID=688079 RepID=A0A562QAA6_9BACI|nr:energy-coupling factor ABC transporter ATP-binding protein [Halalkalibacter nanhaiisediminis]TWI53653.1 energy-coupling factor transport system ATP-binding protein [Halalkalibacter nanhaiisediminis]